jgi:hypothetical protein
VPVLLSITAFVYFIALTVTAVARSSDAQAAVGCVIGPVMALLATVPAYLIGKAVEFIVVHLKREGLHVDPAATVTLPVWSLAGLLAIATAIGMWTGWSTP